jgi:hypothetical protein
MVKRILSALLGSALIAFVIWLGLRTRTDQTLVVWFGLASAILAPLGILAIGYVFTASNQKILERLSKASEVEQLISTAKTYEEKVEALERERARLLEVVEFEARKESLTRRKRALENDGERILDELEAIDEELQSLKIQTGPASDEIRRLQGRIHARQEGELIFRLGDRHFILKRETLRSMPYGSFVFEYFRVIQKATDALRRILSEYVNRNGS